MRQATNNCHARYGHQLWQVIRSAEPGKGTLYLFRTDAEAGSARVGQGEKSVDWKDLVSLPHYLMWRMTSLLQGWESRSGAHLLGPEICALQTNRIISRAIRILSRYETIVADRLHACILGCLLGKKVFFVDNSYGKLTSYYDTWLKNDAGLPGEIVL
jgi:pyruvyl transferase EpsO